MSKGNAYAHKKLEEEMIARIRTFTMILLRIFRPLRLISPFNLVGCRDVINELALIGSLVRIDSININVPSETFVVAVALAGIYFGYQLIQEGHENLGFAMVSVSMSLLFSLGALLIEKLS